MKIAFLIQDVTTGGGTERVTCSLANMFAKQGHVVSVVSIFRKNENLPFVVEPQVDVKYLSLDNYDLSMSILKRIGTIIKQVHHVKSCGIIQDADVVISQKLLATFTLWLAGLAHKSIACDHFLYETYPPFIRRIRNLVYKSFLSLVVLTEKDRQKYLSSLSRIDVIPNVLPIIPVPYVGKDSKKIISVGRLEEEKGHDMLLQALPKVFKKHPDWKLNIFGEGSQYRELVKRRDELKLTNFVSFKGYSKNIELEYAQSAFCVIPSRFESFSLTILEAAACGLPVVSFDCPEGPRALLANGGGLLVPPENVEELTNAINIMIEDEDLRGKLASQSQNVVRPYAPEGIYQKWLSLFQEYIPKASCKQA